MLSINSIVNEFRYDKRLKRYSEKYLFNDHIIYGSVASNADVDQHRNYIKNTIEHFQEVYPLMKDDIDDLGRGMAKYEIAVRKVLACIDYGNFGYTPVELKQLILDVFDFHKLIDDIQIRKLNQ
ncbi:hypothetical protein LRR81_01390 [Metabacillus sp. GX 13764]|uniref:hypothetical protein n=1 Tax=Metabacillus kandeliae TaxID=2900151 RepID=UPI001E47CFEB|nr:hypothetical protein [Metabacillus kandeliae]MCD7032864.1 hypothetical protein [Metabacillus kandeliae]